MAKQQGNKPTAEEQRQPVTQTAPAEKEPAGEILQGMTFEDEKPEEELDLLSGRAIMDPAAGVYVGIRMAGKVQRKLKSFASDRGVRIQDLVATAIIEVYGEILK